MQSHAQAGFYGRIDSRLQVESDRSNSIGFFEEYADIRFVDEQKGVESVASFSFRHDDQHELNIHQLYYVKKMDGPILSYKLGRFERADNLGFYTLDGVALTSKNNNVLSKLYLGKPSRVDGYSAVTGDILYGIDLFSSNIQLPQISPNITFKPSVIRMGWQRLENEWLNERQSEIRFNWGVSSTADVKNHVLNGLGFNFNGSYLTSEGQAEQINFKLYADAEQNRRLQIGYETFTSDKQELSFREQFYSVYVNGRQSSWSGSYFFKTNALTHWEVKARKTVRESGLIGYGLTIGRALDKYSGTGYSTQLDFLNLNQEKALSLYAETDYSFSPLVTSTFGLAIQHKKTWLAGSNHALAVDMNLQKMIRSGLYFSTALTTVLNSNAEDEFILGLKVSYYFDERIKEKSND